MFRVVHNKLLKASVLCETERDALVVLRGLQNICLDEMGFVETVGDPCPAPVKPAPVPLGKAEQWALGEAERWAIEETKGNVP